MTYTWDAVDVIVFSSAVKEGVPFVKKEHDTGILSFVRQLLQFAVTHVWAGVTTTSSYE